MLMMRLVKVSFFVETLVLKAATCATRSEMGLAKSSVLEAVGMALSETLLPKPSNLQQS